MVTVLDRRPRRTAEDFIMAPDTGGLKGNGHAVRPLSDRERLLAALNHADDLRGPLAWLAHAGLSREDWEGQLGTDAIPHVLQENLKAKIAADRAAWAKGKESRKALAMVEQLRAAGAAGMVLPMAQAHVATYKVASDWLAQQAHTEMALLDILACHAAEALDEAGFESRLAKVEEQTAQLGYGRGAASRLAKARYGQKVLAAEAKAYEEALEEGRGHVFSRGTEGQRFAHWLVSSGLVNPETQARLELDVLEQWVKEAQVARGHCGHNCGLCAVGKQTAQTACATADHAHTH
jgi:hypothetical protein